MTCGDQLLSDRASRSFVDIRQYHRGALRGKCLRGSQTHAGCGAGNECDLFLKRQIHEVAPS